ncbi:uncharacterized protein N7483_007446 [Penicillium malachiteum]|uniref:uncharacterized protein n=1 Tax=Penicillium malachiteum TaxID=1324776 RepID=UPI002549AB3C|nr:uncharacterized protein N7483_007446 [Penicillium malachiteum]KAJ5726089.1 hypothetical protein N7483_007446 [Penicillium malachiteum]
MTTLPSTHDCIGCASCPGFAGYEKELIQRTREFMGDVKWKRLEAICCKLGSSPCHLTMEVVTGQYDMTRRALFNDGRSMTIRLGMPSYSFMHASRDMKMELRSEVATMKFFKARTSIPVPEIYHFEPDEHDIGAPYFIMGYIPGEIAFDGHNQTNDPLYGLGTREQDQNFRRQLAAIQVELASIKFDKIGSLYENQETGEFYIGPDSETGQGPWGSSLEYYRYLANETLQNCLRYAPEDTKDDISFSLPVIFERLVAMYTEESSIPGPFGLTHETFGASKTLVNEQFDIMTFIRYRGFLSGPIELQAQFPLFSRTGDTTAIPRRNQASCNQEKQTCKAQDRRVQAHGSGA